jgi:transketolase
MNTSPVIAALQNLNEEHMKKFTLADLPPSKTPATSRRAIFYDITSLPATAQAVLTTQEAEFFERVDLIYRTMCALLYNYVPTSGHPGGSISSGRMVEMLLYRTMSYDFSSPDRKDNDIISYAAGHKAMGLYAMWALRNELVRLSGIGGLLANERRQLRLEDLLGFRRNPTNETPLFKKYHSKALDGHPTCATPFIQIATGASGVGVGASLGLALGALDIYPENPPFVHLIEGEGGMTPGRVHEALAAAATSQLYNAVLHVDWNQASIDSNRVCREDGKPGDYVQWNPIDLCLLQDWNVIYVPDGHNIQQVAAAQQLALSFENRQPTAVVYRTKKGWKYGMEGRESHGAGHKFCSDAFFNSLKEFEDTFGETFPRFDGKGSPADAEAKYFESLMVIRKVLERQKEIPRAAAEMIKSSKERLASMKRTPRPDAPNLGLFYKSDDISTTGVPKELQFAPGASVTLREVLGKALNVINVETKGAILSSAADLLGSTSVNIINRGFPEGFYNAVANPGSRLISMGGICEDAMGAMMSGVSSYGYHIGVTSSYSAFIAALEHVAARLHGIGQQTKEAVTGEPYKTWIMVNAHAGVKTGEDGPTHADPQALQLLQECFPGKVLISLTPWDPQEIWPLIVESLKHRPAVLAPFVTRPAEKVIDRQAIGLPPASAAVKGIYAVRKANPKSASYHGTIVLQGNGVASIFINDVLPKLEERGLNMNIYYVTSVELFKLLPQAEQEAIFPEALTYEAMGITDFTMPTLHQWIRSNDGMRRSLHSFRAGHYLGSGSAAKVLEEAGVNAEGQLASVLAYAKEIESRGGRKKPMKTESLFESY